MTSVFGSRLLVRLWRIRINGYDFSMDIFIGARNYDPMMASMAFPYQWVWLFIYVLAIQGVIYPMNRRIFQRDGVRRTQYSSIPSSQL
jgi:hypothetical protein